MKGYSQGYEEVAFFPLVLGIERMRIGERKRLIEIIKG